MCPADINIDTISQRMLWTMVSVRVKYHTHTWELRLSSYSRIRVLKATMARSPCRKIPKESMKAPFSQPRLFVLGVGVEGADVLEKETAGNPAPPGPAMSLNWEGMLAPMGQDN